MAKSAALIALSVVAIGLGVPASILYMSIFYGFSHIVAGIIAVVSLFVAGAMGFFGIVSGPLGERPIGLSDSEMEKLKMMRAHQRATLEELDDIIVVLEEIRDLLRAVEE